MNERKKFKITTSNTNNVVIFRKKISEKCICFQIVIVNKVQTKPMQCKKKAKTKTKTK